MEKKSGRGQNSFKKRDVKPTIKLDLKDAIYRLSNLTFTPVKDVCPELCMYVINDRKSIKTLSLMFKRELVFDNTMFMGHESNKAVEKKLNGYGERVTMRLTPNQYKNVAALAFSLDCTVSRTTAILLEMSMNEVRFVNKFVKNYLKDELNESQLRQFKEILKYVNKYGDAQYSWASLLAHVVDEVGTPVTRIREFISDFTDLKWRD